MQNSVSVEEAVNSLAKPVAGYLRRYCGDDQLAEDLTQDTLLRVAHSLSSFKGRSTLKTWAFTIATRLANDHFRRVKRSMREVPIADVGDFIDEGSSVEKRLILDEMTMCVREVIDSLPDDYRLALILRDLEELSVTEVADVAGCSVATAKIRIHRARKRLQASLGRACDFYKDSEDVLRCDRKRLRERD